MSSPSTRPVSQAALFFVLVLLAALGLLLVMRVVTPLKQGAVPVPPAGLPATTTAPRPTEPAVTPTIPSSTRPDPAPAEAPPAPVPAAVRPRPANALCDAQNFICVHTPGTGDVIVNPTSVTGTAIAFENTFRWQILDGRGALVAEGNAMADAPDVGQPGAFEIRAFWDVSPRTATGTVYLFESSARDGSPIHEVRVPVRFSGRSSAMRRLFFVPEAMNQNMDCTSVQSAEVSVPGTTVPIEATLRALLATGSGEVPPGLKTLIPDGTKLVSISVANGLAKVVFDRTLESGGGGSCRVGAIRAQITKTLYQFPSIQQVDISVQGKTPEETLQP